MPVETVTLTDSAINGVSSHLIPAVQLASLPVTVHLGRIRPVELPRPKLALSRYFNGEKMATPPPTSINRRDKAAPAIARMYANDRMGDCVIAGKAHALGVWSANDADSGGIVLATDDEIVRQYHSICGPGDNGCMIDAVLNVMQKSGFVAGGKLYKIDGYVSADWTNQLEVQVAQYLFGATSIGINLPQAWTSNAVWDVTNTKIVGGHDVTVCDYDTNGVYVSSWGRIYLITWRAFLSRTWIEEYWVMLAPLWYGNDKLAPSGIDSEGLKKDLGMIGEGQIPSVDPIGPPPPGTDAYQLNFSGPCVLTNKLATDGTDPFELTFNGPCTLAKNGVRVYP